MAVGFLKKLIELLPNESVRWDKIGPPVDADELYARAWKWVEADNQWVNLSSSDVSWADVSGLLAEAENDEALEFIRIERNRRLKQTDWTQGADVPTAIKDSYATYRQALRDMPNNNPNATLTEGNVPDVTWPTEPQ